MRWTIATLVALAAWSPPCAVPARGQALDDHSFGEILDASGIDRESLAMVPAEGPLAGEAEDLVGQVLYRLERLSPRIGGRDVTGAGVSELASDGELHRGDIVRLDGRVVQLDRAKAEIDAGEAVTFRCGLELDDSAATAVVWTRHVPAAWSNHSLLNERSSVRGVVAGVEEDSSGNVTLIVLASRIAWHPDEKGHAAATVGRRILGGLGVDVGLLDEVHHGLPLTREDHVPFYSLLAAVRRSDPQELVRIARKSLAAYAQPWHDARFVATSGAKHHQSKPLAAAVIGAAEEGRYSVAPLFLDAARQTGQLVLLEGIARRAIRIEVPPSARSAMGRSWEASAEAGPSHYFELEVFTVDSQNLPLVCCVPSLPDGFPLGDEVRERVHVAGIFYKMWRYDSRQLREAASGPLQFELTSSPLLVAAEPLWPLPEPATARTAAGWIAGGMFILAVCVTFLIVWRWSRGDRRFRRRILAAGASASIGPPDAP